MRTDDGAGTGVLPKRHHSHPQRAALVDKLNRLGGESKLSPRSAQSPVHLIRVLSLFAEQGKTLTELGQSGQARPIRGRRVVRQPNRKLQPAEIKALVADYATGLGLTALGKKYGLHRQTAKAHLERCGVPIQSEFPTFTAAEAAEAVQLYGQGYGLKPVGQRFGVSANTIKRLLVSQGVRLRPRGWAGPRQVDEGVSQQLEMRGRQDDGQEGDEAEGPAGVSS